MLRKVNLKHGTRDGKHDEVTIMANVPAFFSGLKTKTIYKIRIMSEMVYNKHIIIIVT